MPAIDFSPCDAAGIAKYSTGNKKRLHSLPQNPDIRMRIFGDNPPPKKIPIFGGSGHPTGKNSVLVDGDPEGTVSLCPLNNVPGLEFLTPSSHPSLSLDPGGIQGAGNLLTGMRGKDDPTGIRLLVPLPWDLELEKGECGSFPAAGLGFLGKILLGKQWEKELYPKSRCSSVWNREYPGFWGVELWDGAG